MSQAPQAVCRPHLARKVCSLGAGAAVSATTVPDLQPPERVAHQGQPLAHRRCPQGWASSLGPQKTQQGTDLDTSSFTVLLMLTVNSRPRGKEEPSLLTHPPTHGATVCSLGDPRPGMLVDVANGKLQKHTIRKSETTFITVDCCDWSPASCFCGHSLPGPDSHTRLHHGCVRGGRTTGYAGQVLAPGSGVPWGSRNTSPEGKGVTVTYLRFPSWSPAALTLDPAPLRRPAALLQGQVHRGHVLLGVASLQVLVEPSSLHSTREYVG